MTVISEKLSNYTKRLYTKVGRLNLYISFGNKEIQPDYVRLNEEIMEIKLLLAEVEKQVSNMISSE